MNNPCHLDSTLLRALFQYSYINRLPAEPVYSRHLGLNVMLSCTKSSAKVSQQICVCKSG